MPLFQTLEYNQQGRDFVTGDIHGAFALLDEALESVGFDPDKDRLIAVGDLVDRGPDSARALEFLQKPWFHTVQSNHHQVFMDVVHPDGSLKYEALHYYRNYEIGWIEQTPPPVLKALRKKFADLPYAIEFPTERGMVGVLHAEVPAGMTWDTFKTRLLANSPTTKFWATESRERIRANDRDGVPGIGRVFCGHSMQRGGVKRMGNVFYIDTGAARRALGESAYAMTFAAAASSAQSLLRPHEKNNPVNICNDPVARPFRI